MKSSHHPHVGAICFHCGDASVLHDPLVRSPLLPAIAAVITETPGAVDQHLLRQNLQRARLKDTSKSMITLGITSAACAYSALIMNQTLIKCRHFNPLIHFIDIWLYETQTRQLNIYNRLSFLHHFYSSCNLQVSRQMLWDHEELNSKRAPHWVALFMNLPMGVTASLRFKDDLLQPHSSTSS